MEEEGDMERRDLGGNRIQEVGVEGERIVEEAFVFLFVCWGHGCCA